MRRNFHLHIEAINGLRWGWRGGQGERDEKDVKID